MAAQVYFAAMARLTSALAFLLLCSGCALLFDPLEQSLLYRPRPANPERLAALAREEGVEEVRIAAADGVRLHGFLKRAPAAQRGPRYPVVIVFGGVLRETSWMLTWGEKPAEWGWLIVNYRGYGLSEGRPSEHALLEDAKLVYDWAAARADVDAQNIVLLGRSLGAHVAVSLASSRPVRAAILATPFDSLAAIGEKRYPMLPIGTLLNGRYDTASLAPAIRVPALFVLAQNDDVTPIEHGEALARAWGGPKKIVMLPDTGHRMLEWRQEYWSAVGDYLRFFGPGMVQK